MAAVSLPRAVFEPVTALTGPDAASWSALPAAVATVRPDPVSIALKFGALVVTVRRYVTEAGHGAGCACLLCEALERIDHPEGDTARVVADEPVSGA